MSLTAWRGPGPGRPDVPVPPDPMPLTRGRRLRKRWRYVGVYGADLMLCAARVELGPLRHSFWALWDRESGERAEHTSHLRGEVTMRGPEIAVAAKGIAARLRLGEAQPVEALCPSGTGGYAWTRKRAGVPVSGVVEAGGGRRAVEGFGVDDESAGYHERRTGWHWSAGVGRAEGGAAVAWNLVEGINDPPQRSERAIWVDGEPREPGPVSFSGLGSVEFSSGASLRFAAESERSRDDNLLLLRSRYRHLFGTFSGSLDGLALSEGFGVMEEHEALW